MELQSQRSPTSIRGITPRILLDQLRNTAPYLFTESSLETSGNLEYLKFIREVALELTRNSDDVELSHEEYFRLCLSAHWASVATYVPTDVDNQIRSRLWSPQLPIETVRAMAETVMRANGPAWDFVPVTRRYVRSPSTGYVISGHRGEWFSVAAGAYGALRKRDADFAAKIGGAIVRELRNEADLFLEMRALRDGVGLLKVATTIAHNLGDLDRVLEMWNIPDDDALKAEVFKLGHRPTKSFDGVFSAAGEINKAHLAIENHRNFALRKPRCLRRTPDLMIEIPPFLDDWGSLVARHPSLKPEEVAEVVEALIDGWEFLAKAAATVPQAPPVGYARALVGIIEAFPGGLNSLCNYLPAKVGRTLKAGPLRALTSISRKRFEEPWSQTALKSPSLKSVTKAAYVAPDYSAQAPS